MLWRVGRERACGLRGGQVAEVVKPPQSFAAVFNPSANDLHGLA
jgi:hypothetical protein